MLSGSKELNGIAIKYPGDWKEMEPNGDFVEAGGDFGGQVSKFTPENYKQVDSCILEITTNINNLSPQLLSVEESKHFAISKIKNINPNSQITDETKSSTTLSNFNAYRLTYTRQEGQCKLQVMEMGTVRNGKIYFITYTAESAKYSQYLPTAEAMIQSFKITGNN
ncbi:PsbP-related protein [Tolypothrix sp. PCC 7601]|uniref:PsbP-related protein n=1 Tax=Tolypothrix sp. PCC 7601 TaxID=1188 RepID=UPI002100F1A4|nr:PsbP-related protein [Tolypothrix sp. PCC 7601]